MHGDLPDDEGFRSRFRREIESGRAVSGRYAARLIDGDAGGAPPWLATEYVPGPNLEEVVRGGGPLPEPAVRALDRGLVAALRSIHHARVLHRDLKPANVLLTKAGPKVVDFGIARAFGASTMTAIGRIVGSPGFMSPEHVAGSQHVVAASDVFCLASLLCYAATGRSPFGDGPLAAVLFRIARAEADLTGPTAPGSPLVLELPAERRVVRVHDAPYNRLSELTTVTGHLGTRCAGLAPAHRPLTVTEPTAADP
ncbi:serine/threonine-protein kinase [Streptomyces sp. 12297]